MKFYDLKHCLKSGETPKISISVHRKETPYEMIVTKVDCSKRYITGFVYCKILESIEHLNSYGTTSIKTIKTNNRQ